MSQWGEGMNHVSGGVDLDVGVLGLRHRVVRIEFNNWSMVAGVGRRCKKRREGTWKRSSLHNSVDQAFPPR